MILFDELQRQLAAAGLRKSKRQLQRLLAAARLKPATSGLKPAWWQDDTPERLLVRLGLAPGRRMARILSMRELKAESRKQPGEEERSLHGPRKTENRKGGGQ